MKKSLIVLMLFFSAAMCFSVQIADFDFSKISQLTQNGKTVPLPPASEGFIPVGTRGVDISAGKLSGKAGSVYFKFKITPFQDKQLVPRYLMTLRTRSRLCIGFYLFAGNPRLHFRFSDRTENIYYKTDKALEFNHVYQGMFSWDGERIRVYLDGVMVTEARQPIPVVRVSSLHLGPYKDSWYVTKPWADDCWVSEVKIWDHALEQREILQLHGIKSRSLSEEVRSRLTIPEIRGRGPVIDGVLDDAVWRQAGGMVGLIHGKDILQSWKLPPHSFRMMYDRQNLYLGFDTLFPGRVPIKTGNTRDKAEPEVWGDESFELFLLVGGKRYRFAGNVAGGFTEWLDNDSRWFGKWSYRSSLKMRIDDKQLWQGEVAIPWATLGLSAPPASPLKFNFCRTWRLPETGTHSSLFEGQSYSEREKFPELCLAGGPVVQVETLKDPGNGRLHQKLRLSAGEAASVTYRVQLAREDCTARKITLEERTWNLKAGQMLPAELDVPLEQTGYDRMIFSLLQKDRVLMQEIMPYHLNEDYIQVKKRFLQEKLLISIRQNMLQAKFGKEFKARIRVRDPQGKAIYDQTTSATDLTVPFSRSMPAGTYQAELLDAAGKVCMAVEIRYPGIGDWEKMTFDDRIIPPFTPLQMKAARKMVQADCWGRTYVWDGGLFNSMIISQKEKLLTAPVCLTAGGRELIPETVKRSHISRKPHRMELTGEGDAPECSIANSAWLEYDGVQMNRVTVRAKKSLGPLALKIQMPSRLVKYLHTSESIFWGTKLTEKIGPQGRTFRYYPVVWLGMEDKGLCFFAESRSDWTAPAKENYRIVRQGENTVFEVRLTRGLPAGRTFSFEFGLLASPVRPRPPQAPMDTFSYHWAAPLNRPGQPPVSDVMIIHSAGGTLGDTFRDLPSMAPKLVDRMKESIAHIHQFGGRAVPYFCDRCLSSEYPEVEAYLDEWKISPDQSLEYMKNKRKFFIHDCCPTTGASAYFIYKFKQFLEKFHPDGIYLDFGIAPCCNNTVHGCRQKYPLLGQREFYRRLCLVQLDAGIKSPVIVLHNTDSVQLPAITFATHLLNGEHIRQASSTILHNGKDILDTYDLTMFASELSTLPFGVTNSVYLPADDLLPKNGGGKEPGDLYKFRQTRACMAATLIHDTVPALNRCHYGLYDKVLRCYRSFGVPSSEFIGYWRQPARILQGKDIYVSVYRHQTERKALAVISHVAKAHENQTVRLAFDLKMLGMKKIGKAVDCMTAPDPDYEELFQRQKKYRVPKVRAPLRLGDFGSEIVSLKNNELTLKLKYHGFAVVRLAEN